MRLQRTLCYSDVDAMLYAALCNGENGDNGVPEGDSPILFGPCLARRPESGQPPAAAVATDYTAMQWLPGLKQRCVPCLVDSAASFRVIYERPEIGFALLPQKRTADAVWQYLETSGGRGDSLLLAESPHYRLYQKRKDR
jgi:hypothetical protein